MHYDFNALDRTLRQLCWMRRVWRIARWVPGVTWFFPNLDDVLLSDDPDERRQCRAIFHSMTPEERRLPAIVSRARCARIAAGSGIPKKVVRQRVRFVQQMSILMGNQN